MLAEAGAIAERLGGVRRRTLKLYRVLNGYIGNGMVHVLVIAQDEAQARSLACDSFERGRFWPAGMRYLKGERYPASYSDPTRFQVEMLAEDVSRPWVSEPDD